jgi:hypothetical protein
LWHVLVSISFRVGNLRQCQTGKAFDGLAAHYQTIFQGAHGPDKGILTITIGKIGSSFDGKNFMLCVIKFSQFSHWKRMDQIATLFNIDKVFHRSAKACSDPVIALEGTAERIEVRKLNINLMLFNGKGQRRQRKAAPKIRIHQTSLTSARDVKVRNAALSPHHT